MKIESVKSGIRKQLHWRVPTVFHVLVIFFIEGKRKINVFFS
jgi:hypothetical protein